MATSQDRTATGQDRTAHGGDGTGTAGVHTPRGGDGPRTAGDPTPGIGNGCARAPGATSHTWSALTDESPRRHTRPSATATGPDGASTATVCSSGRSSACGPSPC